MWFGIGKIQLWNDGPLAEIQSLHRMSRSTTVWLSNILTFTDFCEQSNDGAWHQWNSTAKWRLFSGDMSSGQSILLRPLHFLLPSTRKKTVISVSLLALIYIRWPALHAWQVESPGYAWLSRMSGQNDFSWNIIPHCTSSVQFYPPNKDPGAKIRAKVFLPGCRNPW